MEYLILLISLTYWPIVVKVLTEHYSPQFQSAHSSVHIELNQNRTYAEPKASLNKFQSIEIIQYMFHSGIKVEIAERSKNLSFSWKISNTLLNNLWVKEIQLQLENILYWIIFKTYETPGK